MTPRISLITAIVGATLVFAVPAFGDSWGADQSQAGVRVSPDLADRSVAAAQQDLAAMLDARERSLVTRPATAPQDPVRDDRFRLDPSSIPTPVTTTGSGRDLEWPQIGAGFALGVLLMIGLLLAMRTPRVRQPAH
jgi:hypothetical protein